MTGGGPRTQSPAATGDHAPFRVLRADAPSNIVITCDHASAIVPSALRQLGLGPSDLERHIAWDIGAADIATRLSERLDAPAILSGVSRLVIDCNRYLEDASSIPAASDGTAIPGNRDLDEDDRVARQTAWFWPYHDAVASVIDARRRDGLRPVIVSIHSMTDRMAGRFRPWEIALSSSERDRRLTDPVLAALRRRQGLTVGDNEPYDLSPAEDYSTTTHAIGRSLHHVQVEFRQDCVATTEGAVRYADIFADALIEGLAAIKRDAQGFPAGARRDPTRPPR